MLFSSLLFIYVFLTAVIPVYFLLPKKLRNGFLLAVSLIFYASGDVRFLPLLLFSAFFNWLFALVISRAVSRKTAVFFMTFCAFANISLLIYYKYTAFFLGGIKSLFGMNFAIPEILLPLGISFYTFQALGYVIDVFRKETAAQKNPLVFATYLCFFPQLVAGPIVQYQTVENELSGRTCSPEKISAGILRFTVGLAKKVLLANRFGGLCALYADSSEKTVLLAWLYAISFTLQIYFDFSGYSDMAIGLGKIFGFEFPENFNYPYISSSITEFWRRWHITLSAWFKSYVYIPLGGNRGSMAKTIRNIFIVWSLTGLWHGASMTFVVWGLFYAILLTSEKLFMLRIMKKIPSVFTHIRCLFYVITGFVIFNAGTLRQAAFDLSIMFGNAAFADSSTLYIAENYMLLLIVGIVASTPFPKRLCERLSKHSRTEALLGILRPAFILTSLFAVTFSLVDGSFNPFLYFRF